MFFFCLFVFVGFFFFVCELIYILVVFFWYEDVYEEYKIIHIAQSMIASMFCGL